VGAPGRPGKGVHLSGTRIASVSGLRGVVGDGLDPAAVVEFAAAYAAEVCGKDCGGAQRTIAVGHDGRPTAPVFVRAALAGVTAAGCNAQPVGPIATPTLGLIVRDHLLSGGIQVSASHNPPEYNGLKFFQPGGMVLDAAQGRAVLDRFERRDHVWARWGAQGRVLQEMEFPHADHLLRVTQIVDAWTIRSRRFKVVLDANHGAGGRMGTELLREELGCEALVLGCLPDGRYDHLPEPTEENLRGLTGIVPAVGADVGFAQDPDADRLAIVDETGRYIGEELTLALAAQRVLAQKPGPVVLNLSTSRVTEDLARRLGCSVHRTPVGEIHVVCGMQAEEAVLGGEGNGGVIDPRVGFVRDSFVAMALVLDLMAATGEPLSRLVDALPRYAMVKTKSPLVAGSPPVAELFDRIADAHPDARSDRRDGLRLDWDDCWVHVRPSNTEPIVRVIAEAIDRERALELADFIGRWVAGDVESGLRSAGSENR
jgi:phosphomannomutase